MPNDDHQQKRLVPVVMMAVLLPVAAWGMPRFAARSGMTCSTCHVDPGGGGMRNDFGASVYAARFIPLPKDAPVDSSRWLAPRVTNTLAFGADLRAIYSGVVPGDTEAPEQARLESSHTLFLMQADLYVRAELSDWLTLYHDQGVYGGFESKALVRFGAFTAKVGRFVPPFGWKLANHTTWVRNRMGFSATERDVGLEIGVEYGPLVAQVAVVNGAGEDLLDDNASKGISSRVEVRFGRASVRARIGGSAYWNIAGEETDEGDERVEDVRAGVFYALFVGRLGLLGEVDYRRRDDRAADFIVGSLIGYHELSFLAWQGVDMRIAWEHLDADIEVSDDLLQRVSAGVEFHPITGLELQVLARYVLGDARLPAAGLFDVTAMVHAYF